MTTRAELAFKALDKDNSGYITNKEMKNLSSKLSATELDALMKKVLRVFNHLYKDLSFSPNEIRLILQLKLFQLDSDGDGKLTFDEFKKMFDKIDMKSRQKKSKTSSGNFSKSAGPAPQEARRS